MRMTTAWAQSLSQNLTLRFVVLTLSILLGLSGLGNLMALNQQPLIIDRGCSSVKAVFADKKHTQIEVEAFLSKAIPMRFDSKAEIVQGYLSKNELRKRLSEQKKLKKQNIQQKIIIDSIDLKNKVLTSDRIVKVGNIRSALLLKLRFVLKSIPRTEENPYGLILFQVEPYKEKSHKN